MKKVLFTGALLITPIFGFADIGIGTSLSDYDKTIYIPINISESIRIEPSLRYAKIEYEYNFDNTSDIYNREEYEIGLGVFKKNQVSEKVNALVGLRMAYQKYTFSGSEDSTGYSFAPTLGFEYYFHEKVSIGTEIALRYDNTDNNQFNSNSADTESTNLDSSINIRFFF